jgi:hypothetical protein
MQQFSYRSARSGSFVVGISIVILVESLAIHFLLASRSRTAAWLLILLSVWAIIWVVRDYQALGRGAIELSEDAILLSIGRRFSVRLERANIERVLKPTHRDLPTPGTNQGRDYLNMTKPAQPNVLIVLREPVEVRLVGSLRRSFRRFSMHLDDPSGFIELL